MLSSIGDNEREAGREPLGSSRFISWASLTVTPGRPRTKEAMVLLGEKGVGVTLIRSLPAGLAGDGSSDSSSHRHGDLQMTSLQSGALFH